jgi:hypothetical protein
MLLRLLFVLLFWLGLGLGFGAEGFERDEGYSNDTALPEGDVQQPV